MANITPLKTLFAAAFLTALPVQAESAPTSQMRETFCEVADRKGVRSWQAVSQYDADMYHDGVNLYLTPKAELDDAIRELIGPNFSPMIAEILHDNEKENWREFFDDNPSSAEKLEAIEEEISRHGKNMNDVNAYFSRRCGL